MRTTKLDMGPDAGRALSPAYPDTVATGGELRAPFGRTRLVVADTYDYSDFCIDFRDASEAIAEAKARAGMMKVCYVYDQEGQLLFSAGKP
ncbi:MAG: hypothetical protein LAO09_10625 [Acidobacteriia bacterium]|nr:hypothetical protein [Terriglobia bacterium]